MKSQENQPIVTILTPVYGVERYIEECVRSLMEQSYEECRYIFVDDCSPDKSIEILRRTVAQYPHRADQVTIITHPRNQGVGATRNTLLENAQGDYILWVDSDDYVDRQIVESMVTRAVITGSDIVRCSRFEVDSSGTLRANLVGWLSSPERTLKAILGQSHLITNNIHGVLAKRSLYESHNIRFAPDVNMGEDYTLVAQLLFHAQRLTNIYTPLYFYRTSREGSYMDSINRQHVESYIRANVWVTNFIASSHKSHHYEYSLGEGKVNLKKWIARRGLSPSSYDQQIFGGEQERWLRSPILRLYNKVVDINNISLMRLVAGVVTLPLYIGVKCAKIESKNEVKREKLWG